MVIFGAPRTKKNHTRIIQVKGRPRIVQAASHDAWADGAILQLRANYRRARAMSPKLWLPVDAVDPVLPLAIPVNLAARVYRDKNVGDLGNYLAAICDALERAGVVENDRLIGGFDGSRLYVDAKNPRVEILLSPLTN